MEHLPKLNEKYKPSLHCQVFKVLLVIIYNIQPPKFFYFLPIVIRFPFFFFFGFTWTPHPLKQPKSPKHNKSLVHAPLLASKIHLMLGKSDKNWRFFKHHLALDNQKVHIRGFQSWVILKILPSCSGHSEF